MNKSKKLNYALVFGAISSFTFASLAGCGGSGMVVGSGKMDLNFSRDLDGWTAMYADYSVGMEETIAFKAGMEALPTPFRSRLALKLQSKNVADDVWMWVHKKVSGLKPNSNYRVKVQINIASNAGLGCTGIGGSPGESVFFKAGAVDVEPRKVITGEMGDFVTVNFDKGNQGSEGQSIKIIGDLSTPSEKCVDGPFLQKQMSTSGAGVISRTDSAGNLWIVIGTDSGFEGTSTYFLLNGQVEWEPA